MKEFGERAGGRNEICVPLTKLSDGSDISSLRFVKTEDHHQGAWPCAPGARRPRPEEPADGRQP